MSPADHYSKGASDCSVNDSRVSVVSDKPKSREENDKNVCVVI